MKKRAGFTLIELVVGMAIMAIIFGGIVYIFGASAKSAQAGMNYKQAYEAGRTIMDEIKTTMRYADATTVVLGDGTITYSTNTSQPFFDKHYDIANGVPYYYTYTISWKDSNNTQLKIERTIKNSKTNVSTTDTRYYPEDNYVNTNGAFKTTEYSKLEFDFPIVSKEFSSTSGLAMYNIAIPFQYKDGSGTNKVEILKTEVTPTDYEVDAAAVAKAKAEILITAVTAMHNNPSLNSQLKISDSYANNISSSAFNQSGIKGITKALKNYIGQDSTALDTLGKTAWVIVPIDSKGNILTTNDYKNAPIKDDYLQGSLHGWRVFIAKNVINDVNNVFKTSSATGTYKEEANKGNYIIRDGYGFLAYSYDSVGQTYSADSAITSGYMTGYNYSNSMIMINFYSWVSLPTTYTGLKSYNGSFSSLSNTVKSNKYIEDQFNDSGTKTSTGSYNRLDYDASGAEYTVATCNTKRTTYKYSNLSLATVHASN